MISPKLPTAIILLGGSAIAPQPLSNFLDLIALTRDGLPKEALDNLTQKLSFTYREIAEVLNVSERTLQRYQKDQKLSKDASAKLIEVAKLYQRGEEVFDDIERFKQWMKHSNPFFGKLRPLDLLDTPTGFQAIYDELGRIEHGVLA